MTKDNPTHIKECVNTESMDTKGIRLLKPSFLSRIWLVIKQCIFGKKRNIIRSDEGKQGDLYIEQLLSGLSKSKNLASLIAIPSEAHILPLPRSQGGEYVIVWVCLKEDFVEYEKLLCVIREVTSVASDVGVFGYFKALQIGCAVVTFEGEHKTANRIVTATILSSSIENINKLSVDLFRREIEESPIIDGFQEIPEDEPVEGIFCKWYWDHSGPRPIET